MFLCIKLCAILAGALATRGVDGGQKNPNVEKCAYIDGNYQNK